MKTNVQHILKCDSTYFNSNKFSKMSLTVSPPGYYCTLGAEVGQPTDNITGNICPEGYYCPVGSDAPTPCDSGYYLDAEGQSAESNCKICTKGMKSIKMGKCMGNICPKGHYCPLSSDAPTPCGSGYYLDAEGQSDESNYQTMH